MKKLWTLKELWSLLVPGVPDTFLSEDQAVLEKEIPGTEGLELCFHPEVDQGWSFDPADPFVTAYWAKCRNPRCTVEQFSIHGFPTLPAPWVIKK